MHQLYNPKSKGAPASVFLKPLLTLHLFVMGLGAFAQTPHLDSLFAALTHYRFFHGTVLVANNGTPLFNYSGGAGTSNDSRYELASLSKIFTAVAVMQLAEKGTIHLESPVQKYLPAFPYASVKIRHLLSHTSGLPDFQIFDSILNLSPGRTMQNEDILPLLKSGVKLLFEPGTKWSYSSRGIALLAMIVEKQTRMNFGAYLKKHIFHPAGMQHTYISRFNTPVNDVNRLPALMYPTYYADTLVTADTMAGNQRFLHASGGVIGPGLLVSQAADLLAFDQALTNNKLLKMATLEKMFTPVQSTDGSLITCPHYPGKVHFGLGWFIYQDEGLGKLAFHSGYKPGTATIFLKDLTTRQTVILLDNGNSPGTNATAFNCLRLLNNLPTERLKTAITFPYGRALVSQGPELALLNLTDNQTDTLHYTSTPVDWLAMGYELFRTGKTEEALQTFRTGYLLYPQHPFLCQVYGDVLLKMGKPKEAIAFYQKAIKLRPDNPELKKKLEALKNE